MVEKTVQKAALSSVQLLWSGFSWDFCVLGMDGMANAKGFCIAVPPRRSSNTLLTGPCLRPRRAGGPVGPGFRACAAERLRGSAKACESLKQS